nr:2-oxoglutarate and iron-dependent oxygenase JMJD4 isoform X2 [Chrysemys picta bellii]
MDRAAFACSTAFFRDYSSASHGAVSLPQGHVDYIEKVESFSYSDFFRDYLIPNHPCVFSAKFTEGWGSRRNWVTRDGKPNFDYLLQHFGKAVVPVANCDVKEYNSNPKEQIPLKEYISYWKEYIKKNYHSPRGCLYLKDWHLYRAFPEQDVYTTPIYFTSDWLNEYWDAKGLDDYRFVYMGPKGSCTVHHHRQPCRVHHHRRSRIRGRAPAWSEREVLDLIAFWGDESVMAELPSKKTNANTYAKVSRAMMERSYSRDTEQCRTEIKELRQAYQNPGGQMGALGHSPIHSTSTVSCMRLWGVMLPLPHHSPWTPARGGVARSEEEESLEDEEEEDSAQAASGESVFPPSQELFLMLEPIASPHSQGGLPDHDPGEGTSGE